MKTYKMIHKPPDFLGPGKRYPRVTDKYSKYQMGRQRHRPTQTKKIAVCVPKRNRASVSR